MTIRCPKPLRVAMITLSALAACTVGHQAQAANPLVKIATPLGNILVELDPAAAPNTVNNFLTYLNDGDFQNTFIHRNANTANAGVNVIQGGGFTLADTGVVADLDLDDFAPGSFAGQTNYGVVSPVNTNAPIANEFNQSNLRGTIAMARQGGLPDSATSQWFINTTDNIALDSIDGGFTVFGQVTLGMDVVDAIHGLVDVPIGSPSNSNLFPLSDVPILDSAVPPSIETDEVVMTNIILLNETLGDFNADGALTNADIAGFVNALTDPTLFATNNPGVDPDIVGDFNEDGALTNADIAGFVDALTGAGVRTSERSLQAAIPEPGSAALLALGGLALMRRRR